MKKYIIVIAIILLCSAANGQGPINFSSYGRVTNSDFKKFLNLFREKELPISTDWIMANVKLRDLLKSKPLSSAQVNSYLKDGGELITGALYAEKPDTGEPPVEYVGEFYPLFKLPTNGNYVLLVFAQIAPARECNDMVFVLSYDLTGKYIYFASYTYKGSTENINNSIDAELKSHETYVVNEVNGQMVFPTVNGPFSALEAHSVYQIGNSGTAASVSFDEAPGQFQYNHAECRFKRIN